ncbi:hypothetical protein EC957_003601 [Mortierella hygrophila]|uniref:Arm-like repeat domain-containing protein n=1 Tax=Mortierella hygrophila TaxID=979708 RepID=A0A9P6F385_9FUNG|nr:hypothetical protein EC957_003601 [Mortierella hygrophila]
MIEDAHPTSPQPTVDIDNAVSATAVANLTLNNNNPPDPRLEVFLWNYPNFPKPAIRTELPQNLERIEKSEQLVYWCSLLLQRASSSPSLTWAEQKWLEGIDKDSTEQDRLLWIATRMVEEFVPNVASRSSVEIAEVVSLGPILEKGPYRKLLSSIIAAFDDALLLDVTLLQGLVQLVQSNSSGYLEADDLIKILSILRVRLQGTHGQSSEYSYQLVVAVSRVLDVMAEHEVKDLDRVVEHEPLSGVLSSLKGSSDPYMTYQACYAFQALQYVPDNETPLQAILRHSAGVAKGLIDITALASLDLGAILEGLTSLQTAFLGSTFNTANTVYGGASSLMESGQSTLDALKEKYGHGKKQPWYVAIRAAHALAQAGQMKDFIRFICEAPCRPDPLFQWGISQMLLEMASDATWDRDTQGRASRLLILCMRDSWTRDESLKTYLFRTMGQLSNPDGEVFSGNTSGIRYPMRNRLPLPKSSPLLVRVLDIPDVEYDLHMLKMQRLGERRKGVYIPPQAQPSLKAGEDTLFPLMEKVLDFLASNRQVLLLLGDSGAGKSTFNLELEHTLWKNYKNYGPIPLYIGLPTIDNPAHDLIEKQLQYHNFNEEQIREMRLHRKFVLICDGYDESQLKVNIHTTNQFNQPGQWKVKIVISCRTQYLGQDYRSRFQPQPVDQYHGVATDLFQEAVVAAFTRAQIQQYVEEYVKELPSQDLLQDRSPWRAQEYMDTLINIPYLMDLVSNPFILTLALDALPSVVDTNKDLSSIRITRVQLYDSFVKRWLKVNRMRLEASPLSAQEREELDLLIEDNFSYHGIHYQKDLSIAIFVDNAGNPIVKYTHLRDKNTWKATFFSPSGQAKLLRESSTVMRSGAHFRFLHRSLLEYFYSRTIFDPMDYDADVEGMEEREQAYDFRTSLARRSIIQESSIVQFLAERVKQNPPFQQQLQNVIEESKSDVEVESNQVAAANAITILVRAGVDFRGADLRGIKVPGADLSDGKFDYVQFQGANLTGVNLARSWVRQVDMSRAKMDGVRFGELPYLVAEDQTTACGYSPDGKLLAVSVYSGVIDVYETTTWSKICELRGHVRGTYDVTFSADSQRIVSAGEDKTARVWESNGGVDAVLVLEGHTDVLYGTSFSPCGKKIVSCSHDKTIRLWDALTGECLLVLEGHTSLVRSVRFSADGRTLVSGSEDKTIRFWNAETGEPAAIWTSPVGKVKCLAYSPNGRWVATGHRYGAAQLWDTATGKLIADLYGHTHDVTSVAFSSTSSATDRSVKLWDASSGTLVATLSGHNGDVYKVAFAPNERQIASVGADKKVRLRDVNSSESMSSGLEAPPPQDQRISIVALAYAFDGGSIFTIDDDLVIRWWNREVLAAGGGGIEGGLYMSNLYTDDIEVVFFLWCAAFSPDRRQIAASFDEGPIRLASMQPGLDTAPATRMKGHLRAVTAMTYSSCGRWLLSACLDKAVRLWELHEDGSTPGQGGHVLVQLEESDLVTIEAVAFSPTGHQLAVGFSTGTVSLFDPVTKARVVVSKKKLQPSGRDDRHLVLKYSPSGRQLAMGTATGPIYLWDVAQSAAEGKTEKEEPGVLVQLLEGPQEISALAYSPCGTWIASGSIDETVRLWHRQSEEENTWSCVSLVRGFFGSIRDIAWNPVVPMEFVTACKDGSVRVWGVSPRVGGKDESKGEEVEVWFLWGSNLGILCAADMKLEGVVGLDLMNRKLLVQRGAVEALKA